MVKPNKTDSKGFAGTPEWNAWRGIIARCEVKTSTIYKYYGGRGIRICRRWRRSFRKFLLDMGRKPTDRHEIDRIDNEGDYEPKNCRWVTRKQNMRNTRSNHWITVNGKKKVLKDWAKSLGCHHATILMRLKYGWTKEEAVTIPVRILKRRNIQNASR